MSKNEIYNVLVFPEKDLYPALKRHGVHNVSVSPLNNGRENGMIYTVVTPTGDTRSFSLYEHRNTDSMIIGGKTNWNPNDQPYGPYATDSEGNDNKEYFFAEMGMDTTPARRAETLAYFLKEAQEGRLESDQELIEKAPRLDWNAILSKQLGKPFEDFLDKHGYKSKESLEETMDKLNEKDSFARWEDEF